MEAAHEATGQYAFFNHSSDTIPNDLPPSVDDKPLARQKRKRTSAEDQAVLEAAYKQDPKPDKAARLELVKDVALGEKEVQIWFQNRRQSSRRKSRPLLPHEVAQYQMSRYGPSPQHSSSDDTAAEYEAALEKPVVRLSSEAGTWSEPGEDHEQPDSGPAPPTYSSSSAPKHAHTEAAEHHPVAETQPSLSKSTRDSFALREKADGSATPSLGPSGTLDYPAFHRSAPSAHLEGAHELVRPQLQPVNPAGQSASTRTLRKSSSYVRLSMSFDGNASVVTKDGSSPSPPRPGQYLPMSDSRPQTVKASALPAYGTLQRSSSGRSRDSRAWEFWCDKDARSELEVKAEKDSSGSAADAIGLLRSASGRSILGSIPAKRNSLFSRAPSEHKRAKLEEKRLPLQRSSTSLGRLQGKRVDVHAHGVKLKASESAASTYIPGNDSDKENWSPDDERPHTDHHTTHVARTSSARAPLSQSRNDGNPKMLGAAPGRKTKGATQRASNGENDDPEADEEIAAFMRSGRKSTSTSSNDDLDCVQGLLSLSQGNWR